MHGGNARLTLQGLRGGPARLTWQGLQGGPVSLTLQGLQGGPAMLTLGGRHRICQKVYTSEVLKDQVLHKGV